ncbi:hypothetical protein Tco_0907014 [Tanacetum coccineum]|uniref:Reverse transcriptase domain-containing protein n=1 Tax=Tanacetum coccineum TaxID=301880 RepID=A0ABQ5CP94_9ASTR
MKISLAVILKKFPVKLRCPEISTLRVDESVDLLLRGVRDDSSYYFSPGKCDLPFDIESDLREIEYLLNNDPTKEMDSILEDSVDEDNIADPNNDLVDTILEMFNG